MGRGRFAELTVLGSGFEATGLYLGDDLFRLMSGFVMQNDALIAQIKIGGRTTLLTCLRAWLRLLRYVRAMDATRVEVPGAHWIGLESATWGAQMTAFGSRGGSPFVLTINEHGTRFPYDLPGPGHVTSVAAFESTLVAVNDGGGCRLFGIADPSDYRGDHRDVQSLDDEFTRSAARLWVANGDEDPGYVVVDSEGHITGIDPGGDEGLPVPGRLMLVPPDALMQASQAAVSLYFGGPISDEGAAPRQSLWSIDVYGTEEITTQSEFDAFTDMNNEWDPCIAGHHELRPALVTCGGRHLEAPPTGLNPLSPLVTIARHPLDAGAPKDWHESWYEERTAGPSSEGAIIVLQGAEGIEAWSRSASGWRLEKLPGHLLQAARFDSAYTSTLWYIADNELWRVTS